MFRVIIIYIRCQKCKIGSYSLMQTPNISTCLTCPVNTVCLGGSLINLNQGYWRFSTSSDKIYDCEVYQPNCQYKNSILY